jgi:nickel/cobalt transporter (NiCoT) family protein
MRHAFDVDHIAAIDNVSRRLTQAGRDRPLAVGFYFSAGHSSVVFALALALALGLHGLVGAFFAQDSPAQKAASIFGTGISGLFLLIVAAINISSLVAIRRRADDRAAPGGILSQALRGPLRMVGRARHMYAIGFLFGLGLDTATEIGLLVVAVTSVAVGLPWYGVLALPLLFAAGMVLFDSLDGIFVSLAYGWALGGAERKRHYNIVVTAISISAALAVSAVEIVSAFSQGLAWRGPLPFALPSIDPNFLVVVAALALALISLTVLIIRRTKHLDALGRMTQASPFVAEQTSNHQQLNNR